MEQFLEIAALVAAGAIFALLLGLLVVRLSGGRLPRQAEILRFRRSLKRLDDVTARWAMEMMQPRPPHPAGEMVQDPRRHGRRRDRGF